MGKTNVHIVRYKIEIEGQAIFGSDIVSIGGITLGKEGEVEVAEWDSKPKISDGIREFEDLTFKIRLAKGLETFKYFKQWYDNRAGDNRNVNVIYTSRDFNEELMRWTFRDCEITELANDGDLELGAAKLGMFNVVVKPYSSDVVVN